MDDDVPLPNSRPFLANDFERNVNGIVRSVANSAAGMQTTAETMTSTATEASNRAATVGATSGTASENVETAAAAAEWRKSRGRCPRFCPVLRRLPPGRRAGGIRIRMRRSGAETRARSLACASGEASDHDIARPE
jgi:hypothetical protein